MSTNSTKPTAQVAEPILTDERALFETDIRACDWIRDVSFKWLGAEYERYDSGRTCSLFAGWRAALGRAVAPTICETAGDGLHVMAGDSCLFCDHEEAPEVTGRAVAPSDSLLAAIMNLPLTGMRDTSAFNAFDRTVYARGCKDMRHAATELVSASSSLAPSDAAGALTRIQIREIAGRMMKIAPFGLFMSKIDAAIASGSAQPAMPDPVGEVISIHPLGGQATIGLYDDNVKSGDLLFATQAATVIGAQAEASELERQIASIVDRDTPSDNRNEVIDYDINGKPITRGDVDRFSAIKAMAPVEVKP